MSFLFFSHERFSPDSTGIRTLNYLSCCTDWVSRYQPGSERNYRRSGSPNQTTAPQGSTPYRKPDTWTGLNATYLKACEAKVKNSTHQSLVPLVIQTKQYVSMATWHFCCKRSDFVSEIRWCNCDPWNSDAAKQRLHKDCETENVNLHRLPLIFTVPPSDTGYKGMALDFIRHQEI